MGKRLIILGIVILVAAIALKLLIVGFRSIKVDDFHPAGVVFLVDTSASNQDTIWKQKRYISQICKVLDPEDHVKILVVSEQSYMIYEGSPQNASEIRKSMNKFTQLDPKAWGTAYGSAMKKGMQYALALKREGYVPAIIVLGDLESDGNIKGQLNLATLPYNVKRVQKYCPNISMTFLFAKPEKLDAVKTALIPVLGEKKLVIATEEMIDKTSGKIMKALGR